MKFTTTCLCVLFIVYLTELTRGDIQEQVSSPKSTPATSSDAPPTLTEILAVVMITIAIMCMIIVLLLLWCLRRRRRHRRNRESSLPETSNNGVHAPVKGTGRSSTLPVIPEHQEPLAMLQNFQNTAPRPSYLPPIQQFPSSQASSQYGSEYSETTSDMTIADTTLFIQTAVNTYLRLLKDHYQFKDGQVPILPAVPHEIRPASSGSTTAPIPLPKTSKRKSLTRKNTVNMNTYINGWDASKWELSRDRIDIEDSPIGSGYFGDVFKAKLDGLQRPEKSTTVVVKTLKKESSNREKGQFLKEVATHALIEPHAHIVRLIGCCTKSTPLLMVLEYVENGSLSDYLNEQEIDKDQGRKNLVYFGHQIADGMAYLSEMKIVHRDLAARNILITADEICKVSDFGFAKDIFGVKTYNKRMSLEPVRWMAPESIKDNLFSTKSDTWAFGVVLWEIITFARIKPHCDVDSHVLRQQILSGDHMAMKRPKECPSDLFRIMKWCWSMNPDDRPSFHLLSDILDDMREEYLEASEIAFGTMPDVSRPSVVSYNEDSLTSIAEARRISTDL